MSIYRYTVEVHVDESGQDSGDAAVFVTSEAGDVGSVSFPLDDDEEITNAGGIILGNIVADVQKFKWRSETQEPKGR